MNVKKLPSLNGLRAISIIIVIIHHVSIQYNIFDKALRIKYFGKVLWFLTDGQMGVNIFFVISGFLITTLLIAEELKTASINIRAFFIRRILRIFPAYYFMLLIYFIFQLLGYISISNVSWITAITYTKYFPLDSDWFTAHGWSLSIEEHFYLIWPFVFAAGKYKRNTIAIFILFLVPAIKVYFFYNPNKWIVDQSIFMRIDSIAIGCVFAIFKEEIIRLISKFWTPVFILSIIGLFLLSLPTDVFKRVHLNNLLDFFGNTHGPLANVLIALIMMYSVFGPKNLWFKFLNNPFFEYLGILSYSLYLWQQLFLHKTDQVFNQMPLNFLLIFMMANFSYYIVEKPFLKLKSKISQ